MSSEGNHVKTRINKIMEINAKILVYRQSKMMTPDTETH
jgi:hypothetical protein